MPQPEKRRADARRNRERLLAAADAAFGEHGTTASLEAVARRAGVAIGTLYGHFPTRRALIGALLHDRHEALLALAGHLRETVPPAQALERWIEAVVAHAATYRGLAAELTGGADDTASELADACHRMTDASQAFVTTAREAGAIRAEVTGADVFALINAAAWLREHTSAERSERLVRFTVDGLRP
ncbi:helix-turn-helix domain-containing protein [Actinosynnema sp. NPDC047251]|uniref:HTH tetR-type domain-containing protein n=1 Tax=Saccharothrix espanaensis (strain ATCC 51144 / DSM 44229 / JCM 9112 / NBRC 15066 / NRRL 15764) TaxID=1179773 RepID=K0K060_SACES|nr:TetR/AcrR family transcriptional regulator [Saccharothrix espanaensis]CCH31706.1 hypothetical protein BN6_44250 [Saccharothrix espanaensis DSM 44229]